MQYFLSKGRKSDWFNTKNTIFTKTLKFVEEEMSTETLMQKIKPVIKQKKKRTVIGKKKRNFA